MIWRNVYFESVCQKLDIVMENAFEIISRVREKMRKLQSRGLKSADPQRVGILEPDDA